MIVRGPCGMISSVPIERVFRLSVIGNPLRECQQAVHQRNIIVCTILRKAQVCGNITPVQLGWERHIILLAPHEFNQGFLGSHDALFIKSLVRRPADTDLRIVFNREGVKELQKIWRTAVVVVNKRDIIARCRI